MSQKQNKLTQTGIVALLACVCCILWGSAIPVIKTGYHLLQVDSSDTASQIVFAGIRFTLAGILVLIFASIREKKVMLPDRTLLKVMENARQQDRAVRMVKENRLVQRNR